MLTSTARREGVDTRQVSKPVSAGQCGRSDERKGLGNIRHF